MRLRSALLAVTVLAAPLAACAQTGGQTVRPAAVAPVAPIDRQALVTRHNVTLTAIDRHAPIMLGNGDLGFTADITGLQTFPDQYSELAPLLTMAQWAWHSFPNPEGYTEESGLIPVPVPGRGEQPYAVRDRGVPVVLLVALFLLRNCRRPSSSDTPPCQFQQGRFLPG